MKYIAAKIRINRKISFLYNIFIFTVSLPIRTVDITSVEAARKADEAREDWRDSAVLF